MSSNVNTYLGNSPTFFDIVASSMIPPGGPGNVISVNAPNDAYVFVRLTRIDFNILGSTTVSIFNANLPALKHSVTASVTGNNLNPQATWIILRPGDTMRISYQSADTSSVTRVYWETYTHAA